MVEDRQEISRVPSLRLRNPYGTAHTRPADAAVAARVLREVLLVVSSAYQNSPTGAISVVVRRIRRPRPGLGDWRLRDAASHRAGAAGPLQRNRHYRPVLG